MALTRKNKYGARQTTVNEIKFDSKREANRYVELQLLLRAEEISGLKIHPRYKLHCGGRPILLKSGHYKNGRHAVYEADFSYVDRGGQTVIEDVKGADTPLSQLKRAVLEAETGQVVKVVR